MDLTADAADNALLADWDITVVSTLQQALEATVEYSGSSESTTVDDGTLSATANDTSVIIITAGADSPAGYVTVEDSVANRWSLTDSSSWTGTAYSGYGTYYIGVDLDSTSTWNLTADTCAYDFTDTEESVTNVKSAGFTLTYDKSSSATAG
ncbi:glycosyl hydrolase family 43 protein [Penicillium daleae]|uniref:Glycosyl hydrolase family 43 protein n=1 Tax=Penicillium daleae TaxID=63821 RepID=A0AAD6G597_9EURO|nr:glycosyl hydrolase family 43 protein [Penicillium daleae]KAJ5455543.1 glycosyl hydrolase family 43 protein [Penicillium daleae]